MTPSLGTQRRHRQLGVMALSVLTGVIGTFVNDGGPIPQGRKAPRGVPLSVHGHPPEVLLQPKVQSPVRIQRGACSGAISSAPSLRHTRTSGRLRAGEYRSCLFDTGFRAVEPTLGVTSSGAVFYKGYDQIPLTLRSTDRGRSWDDVTPRVLGRPLVERSGDPFLWVDTETSRVFTNDLVLPCGVIAFSDDEGATWTSSEVGCDQTDHQNVFTGPPAITTPVGYPHVVYYCSVTGGFLFSATTGCEKSLDGGTTWLPTGMPAFVGDPRKVGDFGVPGLCGGATGHGTVALDGTVYLPRGYCGQPYVAFSSDEGASWQTVQVSDKGMPITADGIREHEAAIAVRNEDVYYFWVARDRLPYLATSSDGGRTWSQPVRVSPKGIVETSMPAMAIGPDGELAMLYMGSDNSPGPPYEMRETCADGTTDCPDRFASRFGHGEGHQNFPDPADYRRVTWNGYVTLAPSPSPETFETVQVNASRDPLIRGQCGPVVCKAVLDFLDVQFAPDGTIYASFVDGCIGECIVGSDLAEGSQGLIARVERR